MSGASNGPVAVPAADPAAGGQVRGFRAWIRLQAVLSAVALLVFAVRTLQTIDLMSAAGAPLPWSTVVITQGAFWIAWSLWAGALIPLVKRIVERRPARRSGLGELVALAVAPVLVVPAFSLPFHKLAFQAGQGWPASYTHILGHNALTNLLLGATVVGVAYGYLTLRRARRLEVTAARLHGQLSDAQLETLRAQLDPHFLFNALNSIAVLARRGQAEAVEQMVTRLAGLLRHSLESSRAQEVTLGVELAAVRHYLEIEQVRHGARLIAVVDVPEALHDRVVPSFLLQPLVENAVRHGLTGADHGLRVEIGAAGTAERLTLTVTDDGAGVGGPDRPHDGLGLRNTRARLTGLYGARATLSLTPGEGGRGTRVTVTLPAGQGAAIP
jgi:signal transduction histidine kinase